MKQIIIKLSNNGTVEAETMGMQGDECQKYLSQIAFLTEAVPIESRYKRTFYDNSIVSEIDGNRLVETMNSELKL